MPGTDPDIAQVQVQNKLQLAEPLLPQEVQQQGVTVTKSVRNFLMVIGFYSEDGSMNRTDIADYVAANVQDPISRVPGVGELHAVRLAVRDAHLARSGQARPATSSPRPTSRPRSARRTCRSRPASSAACPRSPGQQLNATITAQSRLQTPAQFGAIVLRVGADGATVRLRDVARVELGGENYGTLSFYNGKPAVGPGGAARHRRERARHRRCGEGEGRPSSRQFFPPGLKVGRCRSTPRRSSGCRSRRWSRRCSRPSCWSFLVMYLFLQNLRATLIPTIAVPVVLLGTFGVLAAFGFSINTLTMFGMVLAIGLLVDDAIVVVENVERVMSEEGLSPQRGHAQVDGPDHRRAGRHRAGAGGGVRADGVLRRLDRRHLPAVLDHHRLGDGCCRCWSR